ncbi:MAG: hypothetical protein WD025_01225 [Bacteriovoracaceae bacterium]
MNKVLFLLLSASVGLNVYLVNVEVIVKDDLDQEYVEPANDRISLAQAGIQKNSGKAVQKIKAKECEPKIVEKIVYKEREAREERELARDYRRDEFEQVENELSEEEYRRLSERYSQNWKRESQNFFEYGIGLTPNQQDDYERLKTARENEISRMIHEKKNNLPKGSQSFALSPEEMIELGKINEKYTTKLKNLFGQNAYQEYLSFRKSYNQKILRESQDGMFAIQF